MEAGGGGGRGRECERDGKIQAAGSGGKRALRDYDGVGSDMAEVSVAELLNVAVAALVHAPVVEPHLTYARASAPAHDPSNRQVLWF